MKKSGRCQGAEAAELGQKLRDEHQIGQLLVFANQGMEPKYIGPSRNAASPLECMPQDLGSLAFNVLTATAVAWSSASGSPGDTSTTCPSYQPDDQARVKQKHHLWSNRFLTGVGTALDKRLFGKQPCRPLLVMSQKICCTTYLRCFIV